MTPATRGPEPIDASTTVGVASLGRIRLTLVLLQVEGTREGACSNEENDGPGNDQLRPAVTKLKCHGCMAAFFFSYNLLVYFCIVILTMIIYKIYIFNIYL